MIPTLVPTILLSLAVTLFYCVIGLPLARLLRVPGIPPLAIAPTLGWATTSALALPLLGVIGFGTAQVTLAAAVTLLGSAFTVRSAKPPETRLPRWQLALAVAPALIPFAAILPKPTTTGIRLAPPIFDHVKIAVVDAILRDGLPVPNPFAGGPGPGHLAYYYLWHFTVALNARLFHAGGWQAEATLTFFTAFSAMLLMLGIAHALGGRARAAIATAILTLPGSLRPLFVALLGPSTAPALIPYNSDIGNWLNQAAWVPQHMQSASCVVLSCLLVTQLDGGGIRVPLCLALTAAAGFESSAWVGGPGFFAAALPLAAWLLARASPEQRRVLLLHGAMAAIAATFLMVPLAATEIAANRARQAGGTIAFAPYPVFGPLLPHDLRSAADLLFFAPFLFFLFPAIAPATLAFASSRARTATSGPPRHLTATLCLVAVGCLTVAWLFRSTLDNNDLGWRVVLPALLVAAPMAALWFSRARGKPLAMACLFGALGLPQTAVFFADYTLGQRPGDPAAFAAAEPMWRAVHTLTGPNERIANNPHALENVTPWPVNIGWGLLSDRPSCYAGWETVLAYAPMPRAALLAMNGRSRRIFAGVPVGTDLADLVLRDHCDAVLVTAADLAWRKPFWQSSGLFKLRAETATWALYDASPPRH